MVNGIHLVLKNSKLPHPVKCGGSGDYEEYVKNCEEIPPSMRSMGFYLCMAESFQNQVKAFRDKTYNDAFKYFNELMKRDLESERI